MQRLTQKVSAELTISGSASNGPNRRAGDAVKVEGRGVLEAQPVREACVQARGGDHARAGGARWRRGFDGDNHIFEIYYT